MKTEIIELTKLATRKRSPFGEFLVVHRVIDRAQLFRALQLQDRLPGARLGQCVVALGVAPRSQIEQLYDCFAQVSQAELENMTTEAFRREPDIEIVRTQRRGRSPV